MREEAMLAEVIGVTTSGLVTWVKPDTVLVVTLPDMTLLDTTLVVAVVVVTVEVVTREK